MPFRMFACTSLKVYFEIFNSRYTRLILQCSGGRNRTVTIAATSVLDIASIISNDNNNTIKYFHTIYSLLKMLLDSKTKF